MAENIMVEFEPKKETKHQSKNQQKNSDPNPRKGIGYYV
jgi:hypothetical protein